MKLGNIHVNSQEFDMNMNLDNALCKGSLWNNLYSPYKYESTCSTVGMSEEEKILHLIQVYNFASIELRLYLCTHRDCQRAIQELEKINKELEKLKFYYESKFRALTGCSSINPKSYIDNPWPWEAKR